MSFCQARQAQPLASLLHREVDHEYRESNHSADPICLLIVATSFVMLSICSITEFIICLRVVSEDIDLLLGLLPGS